jgi:PPP family 3-phenylpropionic acid transporter
VSIPYWRLSGFYFFYFATLGVFIPYWNLYLKDIGINAREIGELSALLAGTRIIAPNLWGWIADRSGQGLKIIRSVSFLAALIFTGFLSTRDYSWIMALTVGFSFFWNSALPQYETVTLFHLQNEPHRYSQIRLWGSIGFILAVFSIGAWLDYYAIGLLPYALIFFLGSIWVMAVLTPDVVIASHSHPPIRLWQIIKQPEILAFLGVYLLLQLSHGPYYIFYSLYLKQNQYSATAIGGLWALGVCAEVLVFTYMRKLLQRYSLRQLVLMSIIGAASRWLLIAWGINSIILLSIAQVLHAASFGMAHVAAIHLIYNYFGQQHQHKGQALYSSVSFGLGGTLGSLLSGYCWEPLGAAQVFSVAALVCVLAFAAAYFGLGLENTQKHGLIR